MAIIGSSDFAGQGSNVSLTGLPLNNALGGTLTPVWTGATPMFINAAGSVVSGGAYSGNLASMPTAGKMTWLYTPTGNADNFALYALATDIIFSGNAIGMLLVGRNNLRLFRTTNGSRSDLQSLGVTAITAPCYLQLDQTVENTLTIRILELDKTTVRHALTQTFAELPSGTGWGLSMFGSGPDGTFDDVVFEDRPVLPSPILTGPSGSSTSATSATGSVTTDLSGGTMYALDSTGTPDATAIKAGTSQTVTAAGVQTIATLGLTPGTTGYKRHYLHKRSTGEESAISRSATFNTPTTLAAPTGTAATVVDGTTVTITYTPTGTVSSATASLPAHATPNGAVTQTPKAMTFSGGVWTAVFTLVPAGDYASPVVLASNADHSSVSITGAAAFYIDDLTGEPEGPPANETSPVISLQPAAQSATAGQTASFSITVSGGGLSYQWQRNAGGNTSWANISGATASSYTTPATSLTGGTANSGDTYRVIATNSEGSVTSNPVALTVTAVVAPAITTQPASQTVLAGAMVTVSVAASDGGGSLTYQWASSPDGTNWTNVGTSAPSYTSAALTTGQTGIRYRVTVTNSAGNVVSNSAIITVNAVIVAPTITTQPANQTIASGSTATMSVAATTGGGTLFYQWQYSTDGGSNWTNVSSNGAVNPFTTLALTVGQTGIRYRVTVTNTAGSVTSSPAIVTVTAANVAPAITTQPVSQSKTVGETATFTAAASGVPTPTGQWRKNGSVISGATAASYTTPALVIGDHNASYTYVATNSEGSATSSAAVLSVTEVSGGVSAAYWTSVPPLAYVARLTQ